MLMSIRAQNITDYLYKVRCLNYTIELFNRLPCHLMIITHLPDKGHVSLFIDIDSYGYFNKRLFVETVVKPINELKSEVFYASYSKKENVYEINHYIYKDEAVLLDCIQNYSKRVSKLIIKKIEKELDVLVDEAFINRILKEHSYGSYSESTGIVKFHKYKGNGYERILIGHLLTENISFKLTYKNYTYVIKVEGPVAKRIVTKYMKIMFCDYDDEFRMLKNQIRDLEH